MSEPTSCCRVLGGYRERSDLLMHLRGLHVIGVERDDGGGLRVAVESAPAPAGRPSCGVVARGHGRVDVRLVDAPSAGRAVTVLWRKRRWLSLEPLCPRGLFVEQDTAVARQRCQLTVWACRWSTASCAVRTPRSQA